MPIFLEMWEYPAKSPKSPVPSVAATVTITGLPQMPFEIEKTNEIEKPADVQPAPGEVVAVTNPIEPTVVYSDVPGAGPDDFDYSDAEAEEETEEPQEIKPGKPKGNKK